jgi:hypothetical protein
MGFFSSQSQDYFTGAFFQIIFSPPALPLRYIAWNTDMYKDASLAVEEVCGLARQTRDCQYCFETASSRLNCCLLKAHFHAMRIVVYVPGVADDEMWLQDC